MTVEITSVSIGEEKITIEALQIENVLMADDLFEDVEVPSATYEFDRKAYNGAAMKYLWKLCQSQKKCQSAHTLGDKIEKLKGVITYLPDSFLA